MWNQNSRVVFRQHLNNPNRFVVIFIREISAKCNQFGQSFRVLQHKIEDAIAAIRAGITNGESVKENSIHLVNISNLQKSQNTCYLIINTCVNLHLI